ncbi:MAG: S41 family peptidase [Saprospiraceae bacterium]|nr:S41 family peptidase [Saprospiraceae bacterium]
MATMTIDHNRYFEISKNIEIFTNLYKEINTSYVDDLDPARLMRTGVDAMLESLDPYTNYISETEIESFRYITDGKYNGIGAQIRKIGKDITITESFDNSPAQKAGLKVGDVLVKIDGQETKGRSSDDVMNILKGFPGTEVDLVVKRPGESKPQKITMIRDEVVVPNVPYTGTIANDIGYFALTTFTRDAGRNVARALEDLKSENPNLKGVVFDLRGNGGGLLTEAVNVSNVFIPKGELVVTTKGKVIDWDRSFKTLNKPVDTEIPLVVLIDKNSASASEIVSGVLQDLDRGVLVGQRSFGKGLVQNTRDVGYNSKVKLTTAKYYIPSGRCIQGVEYEDGRPKDIPDSERAGFKTRSGRKVFDGGGVAPDVKLKPAKDEQVVASLEDQFVIFDYATDFVLRNSTLPEPKDFTFGEFDQFVQYVRKNNFEYETKTQKELQELREKAEKEGVLNQLAADLDDVEQKILDAKTKDLQNNQAEITNLLEKEIVKRFYYHRGKIEVGLKNDPEIKEAISLLNDPAKYRSLLGGK